MGQLPLWVIYSLYNGLAFVISVVETEACPAQKILRQSETFIATLGFVTYAFCITQ